MMYLTYIHNGRSHILIEVSSIMELHNEQCVVSHKDGQTILDNKYHQNVKIRFGDLSSTFVETYKDVR